MTLTFAGITAAGLISACKSKRPGENGDESRPGAGASAAEPSRLQTPMDEPRTTELGPLSVGQWTRHKVDDRGRIALITHKVIAEESGAFWVEFVTGAADAGTVLALLVHAPDRVDPARAEIRAAKIRMPNRQLKEIRGAELRPMEAAYRKMIGDLFSPSVRGSPQSDVTTPAGTFRGCYRRQASLALSGSDAESTSWLHPGVPLSGVIKSQTLDAKIKVELVAFGSEGAKSELTRQPAR